MNRFALAAAVCLLPAACSAQVYTTFFAPTPVMAPTTFVTPAPTVVYRPFLPWRPTVVSSPAVVTSFPVTSFPVTQTVNFAPVAQPVFAPAPVMTTGFVTSPVTVTRYRPILGGSVSRTRLIQTPVTVTTW